MTDDRNLAALPYPAWLSAPSHQPTGTPVTDMRCHVLAPDVDDDTFPLVIPLDVHGSQIVLSLSANELYEFGDALKTARVHGDAFMSALGIRIDITIDPTACTLHIETEDGHNALVVLPHPRVADLLEAVNGQLDRLDEEADQ